MKRISKKIAIFLLATTVLTGCGNPLNKMTKNTVYVNKDGKVESLSIETFDKDYYSEEELKTFIDKEIKAQQQERGKESLSLEEFEVKNEKATLKILYNNAEDYAAFTDITFEQGTYTETVLKKNEVLLDDQTKKEVEETPKQAEGLKYIRIQDSEGIQILVDGTMLYYSEKVEMVEDNLVKVPAGESCIIVYEEK